MSIRVAITGIGIEAPLLPGVNKVSELIDQSASFGWHFDPAVKLGKKGLRYKEPATLLGLCSARSALLDSGWLVEGGDLKLDNNNFGVAIASNTGNLLHGTVIPAFITILGLLIPAQVHSVYGAQ